MLSSSSNSVILPIAALGQSSSMRDPLFFLVFFSLALFYRLDCSVGFSFFSELAHRSLMSEFRTSAMRSTLFYLLFTAECYPEYIRIVNHPILDPCPGANQELLDLSPLTRLCEPFVLRRISWLWPDIR